MSTAPTRRSSGRVVWPTAGGSMGSRGRRASSIGSSSFDNRGIGIQGRERVFLQQQQLQQRSILYDTIGDKVGFKNLGDTHNSCVAPLRRNSVFPNSGHTTVPLSPLVHSPSVPLARSWPHKSSTSTEPLVDIESSPTQNDFLTRSPGNRTPSLHSGSLKEVTFGKKVTRPSLPSAVTSIFPFRRHKKSKTVSISSQSTQEEEELEENGERKLGIERKSVSGSHLSSYSQSPTVIRTPGSLKRSDFSPFPMSSTQSPVSSTKKFPESSSQFFPSSPASMRQGSSHHLNFLDVPRAASSFHVSASSPHQSSLTVHMNPSKPHEDVYTDNRASPGNSNDKIHFQKPSGSHDCISNLTSVPSNSAGATKEPPKRISFGARLRRAHTDRETRKHHKRSQVAEEVEPGSNQNPSSSQTQEPLHRQMLMAWKKAINSIKGAQKSKAEAPKSSITQPAIREQDDSADALYRFLRCKQCSKGEKCNDPNCPGQDPNQLPTITKRDLGAEQRRALLLKKANPRLHSMDAS